MTMTTDTDTLAALAKALGEADVIHDTWLPDYREILSADQELIGIGPERIWAWEGDGQDGWSNAYATTEHVAPGQVKYLRRDGETLSEVRAALQRMADYMDGKGPDRPFAIGRQLRAALAKMGE